MKRYRTPFLTIAKEFAKKVLKPLAIGRAVYPIFQKIYRSYAIPARRRRLHKYGYEVLSRLHGLFKQNDVHYYCACGTLLGMVRDGGFIKNDDDIDIAILPGTTKLSDVLKILTDAGYGFVHAFEYDGRLLEFTVISPENIPIDVFMHKPYDDNSGFLHTIFIRWYPDRQYPSEKANTGLHFKFKGPSGLQSITVHGIEVVVPKNAEEVLDSEFGPWRVPDPNFKSEQLENEELKGFVNRLTLEEALKS